MAPWVMLLAQLYSKNQQQQEAKRQALVEIQKRRAQQLGGNTMGIDAAEFNRQLSQQNYASPQELMNIYGTLGGGKRGGQSELELLRSGVSSNGVAPGRGGPLGDGAGDYGASTPRTQADAAAQRRAREAELLDPWDPYALGRSI